MVITMGPMATARNDGSWFGYNGLWIVALAVVLEDVMMGEASDDAGKESMWIVMLMAVAMAYECG